MTADQKLEKIAAMCDHPGVFHWSGHDLARAIRKVLADEAPVPYLLSDIDEPVHYELVHDAVYEDGYLP